MNLMSIISKSSCDLHSEQHADHGPRKVLWPTNTWQIISHWNVGMRNTPLSASQLKYPYQYSNRVGLSWLMPENQYGLIRSWFTVCIIYLKKYLQNSLRIELNIFEHKINRAIYGTSFIKGYLFQLSTHSTQLFHTLSWFMFPDQSFTFTILCVHFF